MRYLKLFGGFLLAVIAVVFILSLLMSTSQKIERSIVIDAPAADVYKQLSSLKNFNSWSVWNRRDSNATISFSGTDGEVGSGSSWKGDPKISGEGKITITSLDPGKKIAYDIEFLQPRKGMAHTFFTLNEMNGKTSVTWNFDLATPRPWNIFNLFFSLDKKMGNDFEEGLSSLKTAVENMRPPVFTPPVVIHDIIPVNFPATSFAMIRQEIRWPDISGFYAQHFPILSEEAKKLSIAGEPPASLYYNWDEKNQLTDMAVAIPVPAGTKMENNIIQIIDIPASKALSITYEGRYSGLRLAYNSMDKYLNDHNLKRKNPSIEQYIAGPANEADTTKWITRITYLVE